MTAHHWLFWPRRAEPNWCASLSPRFGVPLMRGPRAEALVRATTIY
jgi:hypothetical protein